MQLQTPMTQVFQKAPRQLVSPEEWHKHPKPQCCPEQHGYVSGANNTPTTAMTTIVTSATTSLYTAGDKVHLLKTAITNVYANDTGIEANILLGEGYQRSFLAKGLTRISWVATPPSHWAYLPSIVWLTNHASEEIGCYYMQSTVQLNFNLTLVCN